MALPVNGRLTPIEAQYCTETVHGVMYVHTETPYAIKVAAVFGGVLVESGAIPAAGLSTSWLARNELLKMAVERGL